MVMLVATIDEIYNDKLRRGSYTMPLNTITNFYLKLNCILLNFLIEYKQKNSDYNYKVYAKIIQLLCLINL